MFKNTYLFTTVIFFILLSCKSNVTVQQSETPLNTPHESTQIITGAQQTALYLPFLRGKKAGIVTNQTGIIQRKDGTHTSIVDSLLRRGVDIARIFSPEHGFRGKADAGESVENGVDKKTGLPVISLYGAHKKPKQKDYEGLDILLFDIQDVGVRFYTYISTLHYVMESAAQAGIPVIVLDRPNPNAMYIDGPVMKDELRSFVGMHPVPVLYGMSIGEYAKMINGEHWLEGGLLCDLTVIPVAHYKHSDPYILPVKPSPNLPNAKAVKLYPSLAFFEGTSISCGRGTDTPFQIFGDPDLPPDIYTYTFIPKPMPGAKHPKHSGKTCYGKALHNADPKGIELHWLLEAYKNHPDKTHFFNQYFDLLAGDREFKEQIILGYSAGDIKKTWKPGLEKFKKIRSKYLIYKE